MLACTGAEEPPPSRTNNPPVIAEVLLQPNPATASDALVATAAVSDIDGDDTTVKFQWEVDGLALDVEGDTLPARSAVRGQTVTVEVQASDGFSFATPMSAEITLINAAPVIDSVVIDPSAPGVGDDLTCLIEARDDDGDALTTDVAWFIDGQPSDQTALVLKEDLDRNTEVWCRVQVHDQESSSEPRESEPVFIGNSPPTLPRIGLVPDPPTACAEGYVEVTEASVDPDGDAITYVARWTDADGTEVWDQMAYPANTFTAEASYTVEVVADDGFFQSSPAALSFQAVAGGETVGNGIDDDCDGQVDEWVEWAFQAQQMLFDDTQDAELGFTLGAGDVDNDGKDDLAVGRSGENDVFVYLGADMDPESPVVGDPSYILSEVYRNNALALGDADGDGLADLLVPSPGSDVGNLNDAGTVYLVSGADLADEALADLAVWHVDGDEVGLKLSDAVALGDLDGDGLDERVVAVPDRDAPGLEAGVVFVYSGWGTTLEDADVVLEGGVRRGRMGTSVAVIDDVDGDGLPEVAAGAPDRDDKADDSGTVVIWFNPTSSYASGAEVRIHGSNTGAQVGREPASSGDVDGDGLADVAIGSEENVGNTHMPGTISLFAGSDLAQGGDFETDDAWVQTQGATKDAWLGLYGAGPLLGDTDGSGTADLVAGVPGEDRMVLWRGSVQLDGASGVLTTDDALISISGQGDDDFGRWALLADTDGDGVQDMVGAAYEADVLNKNGGAVYVLRPPFGEPAQPWQPDCERIDGTTFCRTPKTWEEAHAHCNSLTLDLVSVADEADNDALAQVANSRYPSGIDLGNWWLGMSDRATEGTLEWSDGNSVTFTNLAGSNDDDADCVVLNEPAVGDWTLVDCSLERFFICR